MENASHCPSCDASLPPGKTPCPDCGSPLAGTLPIIVEPLRQEAAGAYSVLQNARLHPVLPHSDGSGVPHPITPEEPFLRAAALMVPVPSSFAVYVPEGEAGDAEEI